MYDCLSFQKKNLSQLQQLPSKCATTDEILSAVGVAMELDQQKNGWSSMCIHHQMNGKLNMCPVHVAGCGFLHIHSSIKSDWKTFFFVFYYEDGWHGVTNKDISINRKVSVAAQNYSLQKGIPIKCMNNKSFQCRGANAIAMREILIAKSRSWGSDGAPLSKNI